MPVKYRNNAWRWLLPIAAAVLLAACTGKQTRPTPPPSETPTQDSVKLPTRVAAKANNVLFHAMNLIGTPYSWGGNTPSSGFDCSGLVDYVYHEALQMDLPRTSHAMSKLKAPKIRNKRKLASGDLLFFRTSGHRITHVAIYVGNGRFVHAPNSGGVVRLDYLSNPYWGRHFAFARRVLHK